MEAQLGHACARRLHLHLEGETAALYALVTLRPHELGVENDSNAHWGGSDCRHIKGNRIPVKRLYSGCRSHGSNLVPSRPI
ncbi:hypothetical protein LshimejAT787_1600750 [Lyophyllum shimeji]|uniref:Uncharacterized protein n=1 Tax=Lyophyllum shimeji TaxID=47721 RepID=A0A9P3PW99_LYOSH|nr:hypothetical protein LshimejAT787_1600750 [Lyophyllum shimeji]